MYTNNEQIEQAFLGSAIFDNDIIKKTILEETDFIGHKNKLVFRMFKGLIDNGKEITPVIFKSFIERKGLIKEIGYGYIVELDDMCEHSCFWKGYEREIKEASKINKIKQIKEGITEDNIYDSIKSLTEVNKGKSKGNRVVDLVDSVGNLLDEYKQRGQMLGYKGPFRILDKYIGGIIAGKVYTIIAFSNVGKTSFSYNYIVNALKEGKKVRVFSTEEQKNKVFLNIIKAYYGKSIKDYMRDYMINMEDFENLVVYDDLNKLDDILKETKKDEVIFIDFIQNLKASGNGEYEQMTNVAQELQRKAIQDNCTVFSISQVNNESRNRDASYMTPKGSGAIFASSDIILALYNENGELKLNLLKNKFGPNNIKFLVNADFIKLQFSLTQELGSNTNLSTDFT